jgi:hypothetical protein
MQPLFRSMSGSFAVALLAAAGIGVASGVAAAGPAPRTHRTTSSATVWLCHPGTNNDPCTESQSATVVSATGSTSLQSGHPASHSKFDCFYIYPTVSGEKTTNSDLKIQPAETAAAFAQASRFSQVCNVWAPMYRQVTLAGLEKLLSSLNIITAAEAEATAYDSLRSAFEDYIAHDNDGRPIVFIGHSQGAAMLILLLQRLVDEDAALRGRMLMAIILGGNVQVPNGKNVGGSFSHLPLCGALGETGCVIAYSSFPSEPPLLSLFGRPGQGVSLQSLQTRSKGEQVACVNPAAPGGGSATLQSYFPSLGTVPTPWVEYPGLYKATCESAGGATWLEVTKATGGSDHRKLVTEKDGPLWGYHSYDVNLALGNLVNDVSAAEASWSKATR